MTGDSTTELRSIGYVLAYEKIARVALVHPLHKAYKLVFVTELFESVFVLIVEWEGAPNWESFGADCRFEMIAWQLVDVLEVVLF